MKVLMLTPTYYSRDSVIGGGERYVQELCRAMGRRAEVRCVSFGARRATVDGGSYVLEVCRGRTGAGFTRDNPWSLGWRKWVRWADVIHLHQISTMVGDLATVVAAVWRKPVFVTDHGGGGGRILHTRFPGLLRRQRGVAQSEYAATFLKRKGVGAVKVVRGGVDLTSFPLADAAAKRDEIVFVGRLLHHKGPHVLLEALRLLPAWRGRTRIIGREHDPAYAARLRELAQGQNVVFEHDASDAEVAEAVAHARLLVNPAVTPVDPVSGERGVSELMGISALEALAAGTEIVVSSAGALPEIIAATGCGAVFPENRADALAEILQSRLSSPAPESVRLREAVRPLSWPAVAERLQALYEQALGYEKP